MSSSTLILYKTKLTPSKNFMIDNFTNYIRTCQKTQVNNFQYQKIETDMTIKVFMSQSQQCNVGYNYASIYQDSRTFYYFILNSKWISENCIELTLSMDTIHTCQSQILGHFTDKTKIIRQHKDRFVYDNRALVTNPTLCRSIDNVSEGTGTLNKSDTYSYKITPTVTQLKDKKWYLIYQNDIAEESENAAVLCYLAPENPINVYGTAYAAVWISSLDNDKAYFFDPTDENGLLVDESRYVSYSGKYVGFVKNGTSFSYAEYTAGAGGILIKGRTYTTTTDKIIINGTMLRKYTSSTLPNNITKSVVHNSTLVTISPSRSIKASNSIKDIDKTQSILIKILELPYPPVTTTYDSVNDIYDFGSSFIFDDSVRLLKLVDLSAEFRNQIVDNLDIPNINYVLPVMSQRKSMLKDIELESKMYHSDYYTYKFNYDSFSTEIALERLELQPISAQSDNWPGLKVTFAPTNTINSNLGFKFEFLNCNYHYIDLFENYLIANRNNEYPIYNSSYLNYIRTGYNYDKKNKYFTDVSNWHNTGSSIIGTGINIGLSLTPAGNPFTAAAAVSSAVSTVSSIISNINTTIANERAIWQKIDEAKSTTNSISASDDLSLLHFYDGQCLRYTKYSVSDNMKDVLFDLFHYCGYADGRQAIPNMDSRRCFNYIQCDPVFDNEDDPLWMKFVDDVKARFSAGVTYLHKFNNGTTSDWDFDQKYENFETWICDRS